MQLRTDAVMLVNNIEKAIVKLKALTHPTRLAAQYRNALETFVFFISVCHVRGSADKSLARSASRYRRTEIDSFVGKRDLFMCRNPSISLLQRLKGSMSGDARDFNNIETRAVIKFCSCTTMLLLTRHLQPRRNWPTWASSVLIIYPILRIWPCGTTTCSLD